MNRVLIISGCTGTGKSAISLNVAKMLHNKFKKPINMITADNLQIYKGFDTLSNKRNLKFSLAGSYDSDQNFIKRHLFDQFDPFEPLHSFSYSQKVAKIIEQNQDEINIIEGGSPFYIKPIIQQIIAPKELDQALYAESKEQALSMTFQDLQYLATKVEMPQHILDNIGEKEQKRQSILIANCLTLQKQNLKWSDFRSDEEFNSSKLCQVYLYSSDKIKLFRIIDERVEKMVQTPRFFQEIVDFALRMQDSEQTYHNPFVVSIGFLDTIRYFKYTLNIMSMYGVNGVLTQSKYVSRHLNIPYKEVQNHTIILQHLTSILGVYLDQFKERSRKYSSYQAKTFRKSSLVPIDVNQYANIQQISENIFDFYTNNKEIANQPQIDTQNNETKVYETQQYHLLNKKMNSVRFLNRVMKTLLENEQLQRSLTDNDSVLNKSLLKLNPYYSERYDQIYENIRKNQINAELRYWRNINKKH